MTLSEQNIRGVKRKRSSDKESEEDREAKLRRKLHHALREVRKVVKKARTFEVQKTLKKLRAARRKDPQSDVTKDLNAQMEVLKRVNYDQLARSALMTKLKKDKILSADPTIQGVTGELISNMGTPGASGTLPTKVRSRILSSKVLASEVISALEGLRTFLHPTAGPEDMDNPRAPPSIPKKQKNVSGQDVSSSMDNVGHTSDEESDGGFEIASDDEAAAEVDDGWEPGTVSAPLGSDDSGGPMNDHESRSSGADISSENPERKIWQHHGSKGESEFLPSLSVGFTPGDSGSEFSDSETRLIDGVKRNRRGQRARRAIWEKKFGKNANHIKKHQGTERHKPGSVPVDRRSAKGKSRGQTYSHGHEQVPRPTLKRSEGAKNPGSPGRQLERKSGIRGKQEEGPLHPSWEAKKKQKSASIVPSQGTKIIFSES